MFGDASMAAERTVGACAAAQENVVHGSGGASRNVGLLPMASLTPASQSSGLLEEPELSQGARSEAQTWSTGQLPEEPEKYRRNYSQVQYEGTVVDIFASSSDPGRPLLEKMFRKDRFLLMLMVVLSPSVVACTMLSFNTSALYWIGDIGFSAAGGAILWASVGQVVMYRGLASLRTATVLAVLLPSGGLLMAAHLYRTAAVNLSSRLYSSDCGMQFLEKHNLQVAWLAAEKILEECVSARADVSGLSTYSQVQAVMPVTHCPGYEEGLEKWEGEWAYLEDLEETHHCAGWCEFSAKPLWRVFGNKKPHDRCTLAASAVMTDLVYRSAMQVEIYCMAVISLSIFVFLSLV